MFLIVSKDREFNSAWSLALFWKCLCENLATNDDIKALNGDNKITPNAKIQFTINIMIMVTIIVKIPCTKDLNTAKIPLATFSISLISS